MLSPNQIRGRLIAQGITLASIAKALGLHRVTVSCVVGGHGTSRRVQAYIARKLKMPFNAVWGKPHKKRKAA